jgi:hypothetical protein
LGFPLVPDVYIRAPTSLMFRFGRAGVPEYSRSVRRVTCLMSLGESVEGLGLNAPKLREMQLDGIFVVRAVVNLTRSGVVMIKEAWAILMQCDRVSSIMN